MWPKALTQLIELAPHITRLAPLADRFMKDKANGDQATREALEGHRAAIRDLSDRLHADLNAVTSAQTTQTSNLQRHVAELERYLGTARADATRARETTEALEGRLAGIESRQRQMQTLLLVTCILSVLALVLLIALLVHSR